MSKLNFLARYGSGSHIDDALDFSNDWKVRQTAIENKRATPEHIDKALNDKETFVRMSAIQKPKATKEHFTKALNDKEWMVRVLAKARLKELNGN